MSKTFFYAILLLCLEFCTRPAHGQPPPVGAPDLEPAGLNRSFPLIGLGCLFDLDCRRAYGDSRPFCISRECVECTTNDDCSSTSEPYCSASGSTKNTCVACDSDSHCAPGVCSPDRICLACLIDEHCMDSTLPHCGASGITKNTCVACDTDSHCPNGLLCSPDKKECVQCLDSDDCSSAIQVRGTPLPYCVASGWCSECDGSDTTCSKESLLGQAVCSAFGECLAECETDADCLSALHPYCNLNIGQCASCRGDAEGCPDGFLCYAPGGQVPRCIECLGDDMCDDALICSLDSYRCQECINDEDCPGESLCSSQGTCEQCLDNSNCPSHAPLCDKGHCIACVSDGDCPASNPHCSQEDNRCYACLEDDDCGSPLAPYCINDVCQSCRNDTDCSQELPMCSFGQCIECDSDIDCYDGRTCDQSRHVCVSCTLDNAVDPACPALRPLCASGRCQECISSSHCREGLSCSDGICVECASDSECELIPVPTYKRCLQDGDVYRCVSNIQA